MLQARLPELARANDQLKWLKGKKLGYFLFIDGVFLIA